MLVFPPKAKKLWTWRGRGWLISILNLARQCILVKTSKLVLLHILLITSFKSWMFLNKYFGHTNLRNIYHHHFIMLCFYVKNKCDRPKCCDFFFFFFNDSVNVSRQTSKSSNRLDFTSCYWCTHWQNISLATDLGLFCFALANQQQIRWHKHNFSHTKWNFIHFIKLQGEEENTLSITKTLLVIILSFWWNWRTIL